jgi:hypothetical protein
MSRTKRRQESACLQREELETLARHYHRLNSEHEQAHLESSVRRRLEARLIEVRERFDRLLDEWVPDADLREAWRRYLEHRAPEPDSPTPTPRLAFRGRSDAGSTAEVVGDDDDDLEVVVDGALVARIAGKKDFARTDPFARFDLDGLEFAETFDASPDALAALAEFVESESWKDLEPPWSYASELLTDGLVDVNFALTARGRRALARLQST